MPVTPNIVASILIASGASNFVSCVIMSFVSVLLRLGVFWLREDALLNYSSLFSLISGFVVCFRFLPLFLLPVVFLCALLPPVPHLSLVFLVLGAFSALFGGDWTFVGAVDLESDILLCICSMMCLTSTGTVDLVSHVFWGCVLYSGDKVFWGLGAAFALSHHATQFLSSVQTKSTGLCAYFCKGGSLCFLMFSASLAAAGSVFHPFYQAVFSSILISIPSFFVAYLVLYAPIRLFFLRNVGVY